MSKHYKNRNRTFSVCQYSLIYISPYIYPHIRQKDLFFSWWLVGFEQVIFHSGARRLNRFAMLVDISKSKIWPKTPKCQNKGSVTFLILRFKTWPAYQSWLAQCEESNKMIRTQWIPIFKEVNSQLLKP
jgi:hypothetical protein